MTVTYLSLWKGEIRVIDRSKVAPPQPGNARLRKSCARRAKVQHHHSPDARA